MEANLTVVVTGLLGSGKTSACNFFCNQQLKSSFNQSVSHQTSYFRTSVEERSVMIIDTPGFCDGHLSEPQTFSELAHALMLTRSGVHAFGMVIDVTSRFSKANVTALQDFLNLGEITQYTFVIFTKAKQLASTEEDQQTAITNMLNDPNVPDSLSSFMQKINNRYLLLESVDHMGNDYLTTKSHELALMLDKITAKTGGKFTYCLMNHAKQLYEKQKQANPDEISRHNAAVKLLLSAINDGKHKKSDLTSVRGTSQVSARVLSLCLVVALLGAFIGYTYVSSILGTFSGASLGCIMGKVMYDFIEKHKTKLPSGTPVVSFCLLFTSVGAIIGSMNGSLKVGAYVGIALGLVGKIIYDNTERKLHS